MKNTILKVIGGAAVMILISAILILVPVSAQNNSSGEQSTKQILDNSLEQEGTELEGVWESTVTLRNCQTGAAIRTFPAMNTFIRGGVLQETGTLTSPALRSPGHGIWRHESQQTYSSVYQFYRFAPDGAYTGIQKARRHIDVRGDTLTIISTVEIFDVNGNLTGRGCATETARRFVE